MGKIKNILGFFLYYCGALSFIKTAFRLLAGKKGLVVLLYHRVVPENQRNESAREMTVSPEMFEAQMRYLAKHYNVISLDDFLLGRLKNEDKRFSPRLLITFDDGWQDNYLNAFPILKKYRLPALIFLTTGFIGTKRIFWPERLAQTLQTLSEEIDDITRKRAEKLIRTTLNNKESMQSTAFFTPDMSVEKKIKALIEELKFFSRDEREKYIEDLRELAHERCRPPLEDRVMLDWSEVRSMHKAGVFFGAHTCNHVILDRADPQVVSREVEESKNWIEKNGGGEVLSFAYPNGNYNREVVRETGKAGYEVAFTTKFGINRRRTPPLELRRIRVDDKLSSGLGNRFSRSLFEFGIWRHIFS